MEEILVYTKIIKKELLCTIVFVALCNASSGVNVTLCERCFCTVEDENVDFPSLIVDCSFSDPSVFLGDYLVPEKTSVLDFSATNITSLEPYMHVLQSDTATKLYLNINLLKKISGNVLKFPALVRINLSDNLLTTIDPNVFVELRNLKYLNLASNMLKELSPGLFKPITVLEVLILDDNPLGEYVNEFPLLGENGAALNNKIEAVSLENIGLKDLPENFMVDAYNLKHWRLSRNSLTVFPQLPHTLEYFDLSDNPIVNIDADDVANSPALKELMLNNMDIDEIPAYTFESLRSLTKLELKLNRKLKSFDKLAFGRDVLEDADDFTLETLSLRSSRLTTLSQELREPFSRLSNLDLQGNPWMCDCRLAWVKTLQIPAEDTDHIRCFRPAPLYNSRLFDLQDSTFECRSDLPQRLGVYVIVGVLLALLGIAIWLFVVLPKRYRRNQLLRNTVSSRQPYARITIEPNNAE